MKINFLQFRSVFRLSVFAIHLAMSGLLISCEPEPTPVDADVKAGDTTQLMVQVWDTVIGEYPVMKPWDSVFIDVDDDGQNDLMFYSYEGYWHGPTEAETRLYCLSSNIQIGAEAMPDTVFFVKLFSTSIINDKLNYNETSLYSCERQHNNGSVHHVSLRNSVSVFNANQNISAYQSWICDTFTLTYRDFCYGPYSTVDTPDTLYNYIRRYKTDCFNLPGDSLIFIGFRK